MMPHGEVLLPAVLLVLAVATSPVVALIGAYAPDARAQRLLDCVSHPAWVIGSFAVCEKLLDLLGRSPHLGTIGMVSAPLDESDSYASSLAVAMFIAIIMVDCVLFVLWPEILHSSLSVLCGLTINCIACCSYVVKMAHGQISIADISGQRLSLTRYIVWHHTISLMCVLLNSLTKVRPQQACARLLLAFVTIEAGFAGSVDVRCIPLSVGLILLSQGSLSKLCVLLFHSLRESPSFAWQRSVVGMFVFTTWHIFPVIWLVVALGVAPAAVEFRMYTVADVLSKLLITTTMLQGHVKVASDKLVDDFTHVKAERQVMEDDLHEMIASAAVPIIVTNSLGEITVWNRQVADRSRVKPDAAHGEPLWALHKLSPASSAGCRRALEEILSPPGRDAAKTARTSVSFELRFEHTQASASTSDEPASVASDSAGGAGGSFGGSSSAHASSGTVGSGSGKSSSRGSTTLLLVTASVTRNAEGRTVGLVCLCADMTAEVERMMAEASRAQIEAVNDAKDKFLACMSHEMRTPLSALIGLLQLINQKADVEWSHEVLAPFIRSSLRSAEHLCVLVSDVLDVSKVQQGRLALNAREFDLREMVDAVHGRCRHVLSAIELRQQHVELLVTVQPDGAGALRVLTGDDARIQQVLTNLGTNAIKYTLHGSVRLDVSVTPLDPARAAELGLDVQAAEYAPRACVPVELCASVCDTGIGIPHNALTRIFELFETAMGDAALPNGGQGLSSASGIGLTICKELVKAMGGTLTVESSLGAGSTFTFKLATLGFYDGPVASAPLGALPHLPPMRACDMVQQARENGTSEPQSPCACRPPDECGPDARSAPGAPGRLLLVEDDEMNRVVIAMFLDGHRVTEAHNGLEAIASAFRELRSADGVDMIVMDINMPMLTGRQASQLIRLMQYGVEPWAAHIPIVALTANAMDAEMRKSIDAGMSACLTKPVPHQSLVQLVAQSLGSCRQVDYRARSAAHGCVAAAGARHGAARGANARSEDQHAHIEASIPLLRELATLLVAALQHDFGVRVELPERTATLLGCLAWAVDLLGDALAARAIDKLLDECAGLATDELGARAKAMLAMHARAWLDFDGARQAGGCGAGAAGDGTNGVASDCRVQARYGSSRDVLAWTES